MTEYAYRRGADYLRSLNKTVDAHAEEVAELLAWAKLRAYNRRMDAIRFSLKEVRHG